LKHFPFSDFTTKATDEHFIHIYVHKSWIPPGGLEIVKEALFLVSSHLIVSSRYFLWKEISEKKGSLAFPA